MAIPRELQAGAVLACIPPGSRLAESSSYHAGQRINATDRLLVEIDDLLFGFSVRHAWNVYGQNVTCVHARLRGLHGDERFEKHAGASEKHERRSNLNDRESAQAAIGAAGDAKAPAGCKAGGL